MKSCDLKVILSFGFLVVVFLLITITVFGVSENEGEKKKEIGQVIIVDVKGDFWSMGYQYAKQLRNELKETYEVLVEYYTSKHSVSVEEMLDFGNVYAGQFPRNIQSFFEGMGEGSELGTEKVKLLNSQMSLLNLISDIDTDPGHCTYFTIPPEKSRSGNLLIGRNFDFPAPHDEISKNLVMLNIHPLDPSYHAYSLITFPGEIFCATCFNEDGMMISVNNGGDFGGWVTKFDRETLVHKLSVVAESSIDFPHARRILNSINSDTSLIVNVASQDDRSSFEFSSVYGMKEYHEIETEFFVSTNHFLNKSWSIPGVNKDDESEWRVPDSKTRRKNMLNMLQNLEKESGIKISIEDLKSIMDVRTEDGGTLRHNTLFQVIYDLGQDHIHLKIGNGGDWERVPLKIRKTETVVTQDNR